jgi:hypothetical protein
MRPTTLAAAVETSQRGALWDAARAEFVDAFDLAPTPEERYLMNAEEPELINDKRPDALLGAIAGYLAKQPKLGGVPSWASGPPRFLDHRWHACPFENDAMREYLTFANAAEFASRNIFTEKRPLRCARSPVGRHIPDAT